MIRSQNCYCGSWNENEDLSQQVHLRFKKCLYVMRWKVLRKFKKLYMQFCNNRLSKCEPKRDGLSGLPKSLQLLIRLPPVFAIKADRQVLQGYCRTVTMLKFGLVIVAALACTATADPVIVRSPYNEHDALSKYGERALEAPVGFWNKRRVIN